MKVQCSNCQKVLNIPSGRISKSKKISFTCPLCKKGVIEIDLSKKPVSCPESSSDSEQKANDHLTGEALKKKILKNVMDLPPMPQTVIKAREIIEDPSSDFQDLAELFETDQAIATKILKLANSPYYGLSGKVSSIQRASVVLGHKTLGELITMGGTSSLLSNRLEGYGMDSGALWKHSLAVAFGARIIANKVEPSFSNDAFTSGLIHDVGKLILDPYIIERWELFEDYMADSQNTFLNAEKDILELDHSELAAEVCKNWNIPQSLSIAIRYHHRPSDSDGSKLAYLIHVADAISMMAGIGLGFDGTLYHMDDTALEFLGLKEEDLHEIMSDMLEASQKITEN